MAISYQQRTRGREGARVVKWTATVRRDKISVSATFPDKVLARIWAGATEREIIRAKELDYAFDREKAVRRGREKSLSELYSDLRELELARNPDQDDRPRVDWSLRRALKYYQTTVTPTKKGADREEGRIAMWQKRSLASKRLCDITRAHIQDHIAEREAMGRKASTLRNEVFLLSGLFRHAAKLPRSMAGTKQRFVAWPTERPFAHG
jgi:hypothetical protein